MIFVINWHKIISVCLIKSPGRQKKTQSLKSIQAKTLMSLITRPSVAALQFKSITAKKILKKRIFLNTRAAMKKTGRLNSHGRFAKKTLIKKRKHSKPKRLSSVNTPKKQQILKRAWCKLNPKITATQDFKICVQFASISTQTFGGSWDVAINFVMSAFKSGSSHQLAVLAVVRISLNM